jgi:low affinity Fe/Cu permease
MKPGKKSVKKSTLPFNTRKRGFFDRMSDSVARGAGKPITSVAAFTLILLWALSGSIFDYSETWQLLINTTTTVITFLMVFIIQQSQNRESMAVQLKLNELIACQERASNRLIDIEDLSAEELEVLRKFYVKLSQLAEINNDLHSSHSIDEAEKFHKSKGKKRS